MKRIFYFALFFISAVAGSAQTINVLYTTDVHGAIFQRDFAKGGEVKNSMAQVCQYVKNVRDTAENVVLLDAGDFLQGTPATYFYNFINTVSTHVTAEMYNYMQYDALAVGNHDIETGHAVYDRVREQLKMPLLAANAIDKKTGEPYFTPYTIIDRAGKKIALFGLITPHIPYWLPEFLWEGIEFEDMIECAQKWMPIILEKEKPDVVIGMFHAGFDYTYGKADANTYKNENASILVAERVKGFDAILIGHDHKLYNEKCKAPDGKNVLILDAGTAARNVGQLQITFDKDGMSNVSGQIVAVSNVKASDDFNEHFETQQHALETYSQNVIGIVDSNINSYDALFGNSAFVDIVHQAMLKVTGADISFSAPLLLGTTIPKGDLTVGEMFDIYRYENMLNVISLSGEEVKKYLEYSYNLWISNPKETDHILNMNNRGRLQKNYYNFDSAGGIIYTVNPFNPMGERVSIISLIDGTPFELSKTYKVALNSYRYNGGGNHLELGAGIPKDKIAERLVKAYERDLRGILIDEVQSNGHIGKKPFNSWRFVPEKEVKQYIEKDADVISNNRQYK